MKLKKRMSAPEYRALDADQLEERRKEILDAADNPDEDEDIEAVEAESRACAEEFERRNRHAALRGAALAAVAGGQGETRTSNAAHAPAAAEPADPTETEQYRSAFMRYAQGKIDIVQFRALTPVAVDGTYTSEGDYTATYEEKVAIPSTMGREIVRRLDEFGHIYPLVRKMSVKGGLWFRVKDLQLEALWIDDEHVSPYQKDNDGDKISFSYHQLEARFAQTLLAAAVTWEDFQSMFVEAVAKAMVKSIEQAIVRGDGNGKPLGITVDPRVASQGTVIEVTAADVDDWKFWHKLPFKIPRLYRSQGTWIMGDTTWGTHIDILEDDNHSPIGKYSAVNDTEQLSIMGRRVELVEDAILPGFDEAQVGDVFAIYGDLTNYVLNTQPGMPLSTVQWIDHETNQRKIKSLVAMDGKVLDPYGFVLLKKKASA